MKKMLITRIQQKKKEQKRIMARSNSKRNLSAKIILMAKSIGQGWSSCVSLYIVRSWWWNIDLIQESKMKKSWIDPEKLLTSQILNRIFWIKPFSWKWSLVRVEVLLFLFCWPQKTYSLVMKNAFMTIIRNKDHGFIHDRLQFLKFKRSLLYKIPCKRILNHFSYALCLIQ